MAAFRRYAPNAQLIWATTTPVRKREALEKLSETTQRVRERNRIAKAFVDEAGLPVDDLFGLAIDHPEYHAQDGVHFNNQGKAAQIKQVARSVLAHLPQN